MIFSFISLGPLHTQRYTIALAWDKLMFAMLVSTYTVVVAIVLCSSNFCTSFTGIPFATAWVAVFCFMHRGDREASACA